MRAGAAGISGGAAIVEGQRRRAAGHCYRLTQFERKADSLAGIEVLPFVMAVSDVNDDTVGVVVSICGPLWVRPREREVGGIAGAVRDRCGVEIDGGDRERRRCSVRPPRCS